jgi:alpha,alpha-trehalase
MADQPDAIDLNKLDAFVLDMDGVVTRTARLHALSWKRMFDEYLRSRERNKNESFVPFEVDNDYLRYVDGKPRFDGARSFLESRGLSIPFGDPDDPPDRETVCGLGNRKNRYFHELLRSEGVEVVRSTLHFIHRMKAKGIRFAVISASKNAKTVLEAANVLHLFPVAVDGLEAARLKLAGKPKPDIFLEAAERLGVDPGRTAVVEDALAGVQAGKAGGFALVIGLDRGDQREALKSSGADVVVSDLTELRAMEGNSRVAVSMIPSALHSIDEILFRLHQGVPVLFFDYDGTLTPIVRHPSKAVIPTTTKEILKRLAARWHVAIVSGRDLEDVRTMVGLDELVYAGSHGFDVSDSSVILPEQIDVEGILSALSSAQEQLEPKLKDLQGAWIERKRFAIAVHFRESPEEVEPILEKHVDQVVSNTPELRKSCGKKIFELRPDVEWDKGKALTSLLKGMDVDYNTAVPLYIGDDTTDEDAFREILGRGIGILVSRDPEETAAGYMLRSPEEVAVFMNRLLRFADADKTNGEWVLRYEGFDPDQERFRETLCTTGNGYFATRGAAPEAGAGEHHYPGTYVGGCYNRLLSHVAGRTIENESIVNVPNWLPLTFRLEDGEWFDLEKVELEDYVQELDMARGILTRTVLFSDHKGRRTRLIQRRFAHMGTRHLAGLETTLVAENWSGRVVFKAALDGTVGNTMVERYQSLNNQHLELISEGIEQDGTMWLQVRTKQSHILIAEAAVVRAFLHDRAISPAVTDSKGNGVVSRELELSMTEGQPVRVEKIASIYTSRDRAISESLLQARQEVSHAPGFGRLLEEHVTGWQHMWDRCQITCGAENGDLSRILNLHIFHLLQTVSVYSIDLDIGVPPRGLHGEAYRGLIMWDELFIFPFLNLRIPDLTRCLLQYRFRRLQRARWAAAASGYKGAMFPWQSGSDGREEAQRVHLNPQSGNWIPDNSQLQRHINIAVAYNVWQYYQATGDVDFMWFFGAEMILDIARFWASIAHRNPDTGRYEIHKVMGPDEFHDAYPDAKQPGVDNNAYTNVMVAWICRRALDVLRMLPPDRMRSLCVSPCACCRYEKTWEEMSRKMYVPFHGEGIISQFDRYDQLLEFDWKKYREKYGNIHRLDRILESEGDTPNRYKLSKQADVLMLFYLLSADELREIFEGLGYEFDDNLIQRNVEYYLERTAHGSTLSRLVHSWVLSRSEREESWSLFKEALKSDVADIQGGTTHEGIHLGAMAGTVDLVQRCYTGLEIREGILRFNPLLPEELRSISFNILYRRNEIDVHIGRDSLVLSSRQQRAEPIQVAVKQEVKTLKPGRTVRFRLHDGGTASND